MTDLEKEIEGHNKTRANLQHQIRALHNEINSLQLTLANRKQYSRNSNKFVKMLLNEGRTNIEELSKYFTPIKPKCK